MWINLCFPVIGRKTMHNMQLYAVIETDYFWEMTNKAIVTQTSFFVFP